MLIFLSCRCVRHIGSSCCSKMTSDLPKTIIIGALSFILSVISVNSKRITDRGGGAIFKQYRLGVSNGSYNNIINTCHQNRKKKQPIKSHKKYTLWEWVGSICRAETSHDSVEGVNTGVFCPVSV